MDASESKRLIITVALSVLVILCWQFFYSAPKQREYKKQLIEYNQSIAHQKKQQIALAKQRAAAKDSTSPAPRISISTPSLAGSINLKGARIDDLILIKYNQYNDPSSPKVRLLSHDKHDPDTLIQPIYFAEFGWLSTQSNLAIPNQNTIWTTISENQTLTQTSPVTLQWISPQDIVFELEIAVDEDYMFSITKRVQNLNDTAINIVPYGLINRNFAAEGKNASFVHEGLVNVHNGILQELSFEDIMEEKKTNYQHDQYGWLGFSDKYWFTGIIPYVKSSDSSNNDKRFKSTFSYYNNVQSPRYQVDYAGQTIQVAPGDSVTDTTLFYAGSKKLTILDQYAEQYNIPLFDRAVDFGTLYFISKPIFLILKTLNGLVGNFGVAILLLTVLIKIALFPLARKSYVSMHQLKKFHPQIVELKERYADNKLQLNKEVMALYKREKINPASGCLPILLQIPIFFALYRVLYITIEMRHAPFFGWIQDLSAPDPTSIFNLFGLLPYDVPPILQLGVWPIILGITMFLQQRVSPPPTDPTQAKIFKMFPFIFTLVLYRFAAGLVIYYAWNNTLTVLQQIFITRKLK